MSCSPDKTVPSIFTIHFWNNKNKSHDMEELNFQIPTLVNFLEDSYTHYLVQLQKDLSHIVVLCCSFIIIVLVSRVILRRENISPFTKVPISLVVFGVTHPYEMQILSGTNTNENDRPMDPRIKQRKCKKWHYCGMQIQVCTILGPSV